LIYKRGLVVAKKENCLKRKGVIERRKSKSKRGKKAKKIAEKAAKEQESKQTNNSTKTVENKPKKKVFLNVFLVKFTANASVMALS